MYERFTPMARAAVARGEVEAHERGAAQVDPEDLLVALASVPGVAGSVLRAVAATADTLRERRDAAAASDTSSPEPARPLPLSQQTADAFAIAAREADGLSREHIATEHLLLGLLREPSGRATRLLQAARRDPDLVRERILDLVSTPGFVSPEIPVHGGSGHDTSAPAVDLTERSVSLAAFENLAAEVRSLRDELQALRAIVDEQRAELGMETFEGNLETPDKGRTPASR